MVSALVLGLVASGCPPMNEDPDAAIDAFRQRPDAYADDAYLDPSIDAAIDAAGLDAYGLDAPFVRIDATFDSGPPPQCEGVPAPDPSEYCKANSDCTDRGLTDCRFAYATGECSVFAGELVDDCRTDADCADFMPTRDAALDLDAGGGAIEYECNVYFGGCPWPQYRCEPRCVGADCPNSSCVTDGYECPRNSVCMPESLHANGHGCSPTPCRTDSDCDCGYCNQFGLCANGAGRCE